MNRAFILAALVVLLLSGAALARNPDDLCTAGKGSATRPLWQNYLLRVAPSRDKRACTAELDTPDGGVIFSRDEDSFRWNRATGRDINGDKQPDLVIEGFTAGAHKYWIFSPAPEPMLVGHLNNDEPVSFGYDGRGRMVLHTEDEAFNNFDGLPYDNSPRAQLFFVLDGDRFKDVTADFVTDASIQSLRKRLEMLPTARFRQVSSAQDIGPELFNTKQTVLELVLACLDSGREADAWRALDEFWPPSDIPRIKQAIAAARAKGTMKTIADWNRDHFAE